MSLAKYILVLFWLVLACLARAQDSEEEHDTTSLKKLVSEISLIHYKKGEDIHIPFGRLEFSDVDVVFGDLPFNLSNSQYKDGQATFNTNIYLQENGLIFEGINRNFTFKPPIEQDSFVRTIEQATIEQLKTNINSRRFILTGDLFDFQSPSIDMRLENFDVFCNKKAMLNENDLSSITNSCWSDGKIRPTRSDKKDHTLNMGLNYLLEDERQFKLYSRIKNIKLDAKDKIIEFSTAYLETGLDNLFQVTSGPISLECKHSRRREFKVDQFQDNCLNEFAITQDNTQITYFYTPEATEEDPRPEMTNMVINLENSKVETTSRELLANIDALNIEQKSGLAFGLFNLDLKCPKYSKFSSFDNTAIINTCLSEAKITKRKDDKPSQAKIEMKQTNDDTIINVIMNVNEVESNAKIGKFNLDLFKIWYANKSSQYEILFPKTKMYCNRQEQDSKEDIHLLNDCLTSNSISTGPSLVDGVEGGLKFYISPLDFNTTKDGIRAHIQGMQFMDVDFHSNIMGNTMVCDTLNGQLGQSLEEVMKGCLKKGKITIDKIANVDHKKKDTKTHGEYRTRYDKGEDPFKREDLKQWDMKNLNLNFEDHKFKLKTQIKVPLFLGLPAQEFEVEANGGADYEIEKNGNEWLILKMNKASIQKLFAFVNGDNRTGLIMLALRKLMPEDRIKVSKTCAKRGKDKDSDCNEVRILMN